ncbi:hypothetical protein [Sphingomonas soli]|uniref:hypothetical protein n=1 Tax=Sphingomonas soli TaxID=266127 RepID=UPI000A5A057F|nr:hypothetical protein [Sphingomonas soli]
MASLRTIARTHRNLAALIVVAALLLRILVPAGFMPVVRDGRMVMSICSGMGPTKIVVEIPGLKHQPEDRQAQSPCAFADLSLPSLAGADPIQLAVLVAFVLALGLTFSPYLPPRAILRLRPPLRGPPVLA